jgi:hypothetical protein
MDAMSFREINQIIFFNYNDHCDFPDNLTISYRFLVRKTRFTDPAFCTLYITLMKVHIP